MSRHDWKVGGRSRQPRIRVVLKPTMRLHALTEADRRQIRELLQGKRAH
jgi:hypothetical protein